MMQSNTKELYPILGYTFKNEALLRQALTLGFGDHFKGYERLEFVGDRVLGLTVATMLFESFPTEPEGDMARRFSELVRAETLAIVADKLGLNKYLICSHLSNMPALTKAIMSDVCEAVIAAIYLDSDFSTAESFVRKHWDSLMHEIALPPVDAKTRLQEFVQSKKLPLPEYKELDRSGPDHSPVFTMQVRVKGFEPCNASGSSKREASQLAAEKMLQEMKKK